MGDNFHPQDNQIPIKEDEERTGVMVTAAHNTEDDATDLHHTNDGEQMHVDPTEAAAATTAETEPGIVVHEQEHGHVPDEPSALAPPPPGQHGADAMQQVQVQVQAQAQAQAQEELQHFVEQNDLITTAAAQASAAVAEHLEQMPQAHADPHDQVQVQTQDPVSQVQNVQDVQAPVQVQVQDTVDTVANAIANATGDLVHAPMPALHQAPLHIPQPSPSVTYPSLAVTAVAHTPTTPTKPSTKQERMDAIWMKHYRELQNYKSNNGHVRVPRKSGPLGEWVRTQRRYYKLWRRGESVPLTKERMELLDQLGFVWLPAEEKVGGGFRGGRPRKRKREEEDVLAAANAAAAAALVAGQATPGYYHHPLMQDGQGHVGLNVGTPGSVGGMEDPNATGVGAEAGATPGTPAGAEGVEGAPTSTPIVPTYTPYHHSHHHDPYHYFSMTKRSDIANQIELLTNRQPLPKKAPQAQVQQADDNSAVPTNESVYKTDKLNEAHTYYDDVVLVLKRSNEELRDAELALDRAKKKYDEAQALKDKADNLLSIASEGVLQAELDDGDGEWIHMYKCLVKYKEQHGNILFPRTSINGKNSVDNGNNNSSAQGNASGGSSSEPVITYGTMDLAIPKVEEGEGEPQAQTEGKVDEAVATTNTSVDLDAAVVAANAEDTGTTTAGKEGAEAAVESSAEALLPEAPVEMTEETPQEGGTDSVAAGVATAAETTTAENGSENVEMQVDNPPQPDGLTGDVQTTSDDKEGEKKDGSEAMDVDPPASESATTAATGEGAVQDFVRVYEELPKPGDAGTITVPSTMEESRNSGVNTVTVTEAMLHDWVGKMRKFPKKQFKKWRRHSLDKLGFVWHQYNATWTDRYRELVEFRNKEGHTVVPTSNNNLGIWVGTQRKQYRLMQQGKPSHMTVERVEMLNQIDFVWHVNTWNERFEELKAFKESTGHFLVPTDYNNKQLRPWITTQRSHYRFLQEGKPTQLTPERIEQLDKIGFPWKTREDWQTRYHELVQYINENGNSSVPRNYTRFPKLYRWVNCQRMEYQKHTEGSTSRLKPDQITLLENLNFE